MVTLNAPYLAGVPHLPDDMLELCNNPSRGVPPREQARIGVEIERIASLIRSSRPGPMKTRDDEKPSAPHGRRVSGGYHRKGSDWRGDE